MEGWVLAMECRYSSRGWLLTVNGWYLCGGLVLAMKYVLEVENWYSGGNAILLVEGRYWQWKDKHWC